MKKSRFILLAVSVAAIALLTGCGKIKPGISSKNMVTKNSDNIAQFLKKQGFTNISTEPVQRSKADYTLVNGEIDYVLIDGVEDFEADDKFKANAPVIITYIDRPAENRKQRRGFDKKSNAFVNLKHYRFEVPDYVEVTDLTKDTASCSLMNSDGSEEDAHLNVFTEVYGNDVYGYSSLDENKEDWIDEYLSGERDKFKLLSAKNFESEDGSLKGISFDYVYSDAGLWTEGIMAVVPYEDEMLIFELIQPDTSTSLYGTDLEGIATSVIEYRNVVTIADTDFAIPFAWNNHNSFSDEEMALIANVSDLTILDSFALVPTASRNTSSNIIGVLLQGNDLFYPINYKNIDNEVDDYISSLYWFANADDATYEAIGDLKGVTTIVPESSNYYHFYIAVTPDDDVCMLIMGDEDNDYGNNQDNQKIFREFLASGRAHYK